MIHGLLRISCSRNPKTPQIRSFFYEKWLLFGVLRVPSSKALSCKHERLFDLLTLVSYKRCHEPHQLSDCLARPFIMTHVEWRHELAFRECRTDVILDRLNFRHAI